MAARCSAWVLCLSLLGAAWFAVWPRCCSAVAGAAALPLPLPLWPCCYAAGWMLVMLPAPARAFLCCCGPCGRRASVVWARCLLGCWAAGHLSDGGGALGGLFCRAFQNASTASTPRCNQLSANSQGTPSLALRNPLRPSLSSPRPSPTGHSCHTPRVALSASGTARPASAAAHGRRARPCAEWRCCSFFLCA